VSVALDLLRHFHLDNADCISQESAALLRSEHALAIDGQNAHAHLQLRPASRGRRVWVHLNDGRRLASCALQLNPNWCSTVLEHLHRERNDCGFSFSLLRSKRWSIQRRELLLQPLLLLFLEMATNLAADLVPDFADERTRRRRSRHIGLPWWRISVHGGLNRFG
jgi:hypothetical protein